MRQKRNEDRGQGIVGEADEVELPRRAIASAGKLGAATKMTNVPEEGAAISVVIFDDATEALDRYENLFKESSVKLTKFRLPRVEREGLRKANPDLVIVDLLMGNSREDGFLLLGKLLRVPELAGVPIVVCSKFVNPGGDDVTRNLIEAGAVAAYGKYPMPDAKTFLHHARGHR